MSKTSINPESEMMKHILGKWISKPVHAAVVFGIPDILGEGEKSIAQLAGATQTRPDLLYRMMRALSCVGIFAETNPKSFQNTELSQCLTQNRLGPAALLFLSGWHDKMWGNLTYSIQTGKSAFEKEFGQPAFSWLEKNPEQAKQFHLANRFKAATSHRVLVELYDFADISSLTDVGGGLGGLMVEILLANPHMKGVVADLPNAVEHLEPVVQKNRLQGRMQGVVCDFFEEIPGGSDAYLLSHVLHDWPDEKCAAILKNCRSAMKKDARLLIVEAIIKPGNDFSISKLMDLEVLLMGNGKERNQEEFIVLLESSGFHLSRIISPDNSDGPGILEAMRV